MIHENYKKPEQDIQQVLHHLCQDEITCFQSTLDVIDDEINNIDNFYDDQEKLSQYSLYENSQKAIANQDKADLSEITRERFNERFVYEWYLEVMKLVAKRRELLLMPGFHYTDFIHYSGRDLQELLFNRYNVLLDKIDCLVVTLEKWEQNERFSNVSESINGVLLWLDKLKKKYCHSLDVLQFEVRQRLIFDYGLNTQCEDRLFYLSGFTSVKVLELRNKYRKEPVYASPRSKDIVFEKSIRENLSGYIHKYTPQNKAREVAEEAISFLPTSCPLSPGDFPNKPIFFTGLRKGQNARYEFFSSWQFVETCKLLGAINQPFALYQMASPHNLLNIYMLSVKCAEGILPKEMSRVSQIKNKLNSFIHKKAKQVFEDWIKYLGDSRIELLKKRIQILQMISGSEAHREKLEKDKNLKLKFDSLYNETLAIANNIADEKLKDSMLDDIYKTNINFKDYIDPKDIVDEDDEPNDLPDLVEKTTENSFENKVILDEAKSLNEESAELKEKIANKVKFFCKSGEKKLLNIEPKSIFESLAADILHFGNLMICDESLFETYCKNLENLAKDISDTGMDYQYLYVSKYLMLLAKQIEASISFSIPNSSRYEKLNTLIRALPALEIQSCIENFNTAIGALIIRAEEEREDTLEGLKDNANLFAKKVKNHLVNTGSKSISKMGATLAG